MNIRLFFLFILFANVNICYSQDLVFEKMNLTFEQPVDIVSTYIDDDNRLFVVEKTGKIFIIEDPNADIPIKIETPFLDLSNVINSTQEGGLLGMAFSPEFDEKGYFFVNYTFNDASNGQKFTTRISRFNVFDDNNNLADPSTEVEVLKIEQPAFNHNGGELLFGPDEMLYIPLGDGGGANDQYENGQNVQSLLGKILRLDVKQLPYEVPADNPFNADPTILDEIWAIGTRNPWKVSFDAVTGDLWIGDVGQNDFEEVNFQPAGFAGANYGWNCFEGSELFGPFACVEPIIHAAPVFEYDHQGEQKSITGGYLYRGSRHPDLYGKYVFSDYVESDEFWITELADGIFTTTKYEIQGNNIPSKISTFGEDCDHELYFATFIDGKIWKLMTTVVNNSTELTADYYQLSPNPVSNKLFINSNISHGETITIYDLTGHQVLVQDYNDTIDVQGFTSGIYIISIDSKDGFWKSTFVKL